MGPRPGEPGGNWAAHRLCSPAWCCVMPLSFFSPLVIFWLYCLETEAVSARVSFPSKEWLRCSVPRCLGRGTGGCEDGSCCGREGVRRVLLLGKGVSPQRFAVAFPKHRRNHVLMWALPGCLCHCRGDSFLPGKIKKGFFVISVGAAVGGDEMLPRGEMRCCPQPPRAWGGDGGCRAPAVSLLSWSCRDAWHAAVPGLWIPSVPSRLHGSAQAGDG